jgi:hypothetical protein
MPQCRRTARASQCWGVTTKLNLSQKTLQSGDEVALSAWVSLGRFIPRSDGFRVLSEVAGDPCELKVESTLLVSGLISSKLHSRFSLTAAEKDTKPVMLQNFEGFYSFVRFFGRFCSIFKYWRNIGPANRSWAFEVVEVCFEWFTNSVFLVWLCRPLCGPASPLSCPSRCSGSLKSADIGRQALRNQSLLRIWMISRSFC